MLAPTFLLKLSILSMAGSVTVTSVTGYGYPEYQGSHLATWDNNRVPCLRKMAAAAVPGQLPGHSAARARGRRKGYKESSGGGPRVSLY